MKKYFFIVLIFWFFNANSQVFPSYNAGNPWRLEFPSEYCESLEKEKHLWQSINFFAKSIINTFPAVPPEQLSYIKNEQESGNSDRQINITLNPFYKIKDTLETAENLEIISRDYIKRINIITYLKKTEYIGRIMANVQSTAFDHDDAKHLSRELESRGYHIEEKNLRDTYLGIYFLRSTMIRHLICYGKNNIRTR